MGNIRKWFILNGCKGLGKEIVVDSNVKILRFPQNISLRDKVILKEGVRICPTNQLATISIGKRSTIGYHTMIFATKNITIGADCLIAPFCYIIDSNHQIKKDKLINSQPIEAKSIIIGNDVWLGANVTVLPNVKIGNGAVIAAGSVVNRNIPPYTVFGGVPAIKLNDRK